MLTNVSKWLYYICWEREILQANWKERSIWTKYCKHTTGNPPWWHRPVSKHLQLSPAMTYSQPIWPFDASLKFHHPQTTIQYCLCGKCNTKEFKFYGFGGVGCLNCWNKRSDVYVDANVCFQDVSQVIKKHALGYTRKGDIRRLVKLLRYIYGMSAAFKKWFKCKVVHNIEATEVCIC